MSDLKAGDLVEMNVGFVSSSYRGDKMTFIGMDGNIATLSMVIQCHKDNFKKYEFSLLNYYLKSNRYTLSQLIKASEFKAIDLSVQMGKERTYLSSTASESRFNGRGDITQVKLDEIKLNMSLAEMGLKIKRDGLSRETISAEKPDFTFDIPKDLGDENQTIDFGFKKPKHNLNLIAFFATIAILVILLSIGYKYIF